LNRRQQRERRVASLCFLAVVVNRFLVSHTAIGSIVVAIVVLIVVDEDRDNDPLPLDRSLLVERNRRP